MSYTYSEDALVEQPAIALLGELGWETMNAYQEFAHGASVLGRETRNEVILTQRLRPALEQLNPELPPAAIDEAVTALQRDRSRMSRVAANKEIYHALKNGVRVTVPDPEGDGEMVALVRVVDWDIPENNDFLLCSQLWVAGEMYTRRPDLVGFVNGLPLLFIELKAAHKGLESAYKGNLRDYKDTIPHLFWANALIILSNGSESRLGSVSAGWEHFADWKKIGSEEETATISLETMLRGTCAPERFLDIVENFTLFQDVPGGQVKLVSKNHQYLGVNSALEALANVQERGGRLGIFWHTQGSGKSVSMVFFAQKVLRRVPGNWTFVVVTDRKELDTQIYKNFVSSGVVTEEGAQATSSAGLRQLLAEDHRYVFTLIHKFRTEPGTAHPVLSTRSDIIVIADEAHRSQYDTMALNMRTALPNAAFLAFTGTPLIVGEEKTRDVFGDYVSVYDFRQSVEDRATVPLYYENRIPELQLVNEHINEDMERLLEDAELDEEQEKKLEREFAREYHLITRDERLEAVAKDLVDHFIARGFQGKAMMICIDKATAVRMYDKVQRAWAERLAEAEADFDAWCELPGYVMGPEEEPPELQHEQALKDRIRSLKEIDMAVVVSQAQNEIRDMKAKGLDILPHRKRMVEDDLETKFKDPKDDLQLVFVCAMWITGFDVPSCSTLYLDKPMRNHTLMQTIARANRVFAGKVNGLIVDYAGVFRNLEKALAIYGGGGATEGGEDAGGGNPVADKGVLVTALTEVIAETRALCEEHAVDLLAIHEAEGFDRIKLMEDAVEALLVTEAVKRRYLDLSNGVKRLYKAILPDDSAEAFAGDVFAIQYVAEKIRAKTEAPDISSVMQDVEELLDQSIATEGYVIREGKADYGEEHWIDLSNVDFDALAARFKIGRKRTMSEQLKVSVAQKVIDMVRQNRTRIDFMERFQAMIDAYNAGSLNVEEFFSQLVAFARSLDEEEQRGVSENLTEEELVIFDLLTKPAIELSEKEREKVRSAAREMLETLKAGKLVLDWRKRQQSRAEVRVAIETVLDAHLPRAYTPELFEQKATEVFQHVYEAYYGAGRGVYFGA